MNVKEGQSLLDLALQAFGTTEAVFHLIDDNDAIEGITSEIEAGIHVNVYEHDDFTDKRVLKFYNDNDVEPATDVDKSLYVGNWILSTGIWNDNGVWIDDAFWIDSL